MAKSKKYRPLPFEVGNDVLVPKEAITEQQQHISGVLGTLTRYNKAQKKAVLLEVEELNKKGKPYDAADLRREDAERETSEAPYLTKLEDQVAAYGKMVPSEAYKVKQASRSFITIEFDGVELSFPTKGLKKVNGKSET